MTNKAPLVPTSGKTDRPTLAPSEPAPLTPPLVGAPTPRASPPTGDAPSSVALRLIDYVGDIVGMALLRFLCLKGRLDGLETMLAIGAILGVGTGLRQLGAYDLSTTTRLGATGTLVLFVSQHAGPMVSAGLAAVVRGRGLTLLCLAALMGCGGGTFAAADNALKVSAAVLDGARIVRRHVCAPELDPLLGNPREPATALTAPSASTTPAAPPPTPSAPVSSPAPIAAPATPPAPPAALQDGGL